MNFNHINNAIACPCHHCQERSTGCHGHCEAYRDYEQRNADYRDHIHREANKAHWAKETLRKSRY